MMVFVKKAASRTACIRMQHTNIRFYDYGINPFSWYASLKNPQNTTQNIKKFLKDQPQTYDHEAIKKEIQIIHKILIDQAQMAKEIHYTMNAAIDEHNKSCETFVERRIYLFERMHMSHYIPYLYQKLPDGYKVDLYKKIGWENAIEQLHWLYRQEKINKNNCAGILFKKMPGFISGYGWADAFDIILKIIENNKEQLDPYQNCVTLTYGFLGTTQNDLDELRQVTKELQDSLIRVNGTKVSE